MQRHTIIGARLFKGLRTDFDEVARRRASSPRAMGREGVPGGRPGGRRGMGEPMVPIHAACGRGDPAREDRRLADVYDALTSRRCTIRLAGRSSVGADPERVGRPLRSGAGRPARRPSRSSTAFADDSLTEGVSLSPDSRGGTDTQPRRSTSYQTVTTEVIMHDWEGTEESRPHERAGKGIGLGPRHALRHGRGHGILERLDVAVQEWPWTEYAGRSRSTCSRTSTGRARSSPRTAVASWLDRSIRFECRCRRFPRFEQGDAVAGLLERDVEARCSGEAGHSGIEDIRARTRSPRSGGSQRSSRRLHLAGSLEIC